MVSGYGQKIGIRNNKQTRHQNKYDQIKIFGVKYFCKVTIVVLDPFEEIFILICLVIALHLIYVSKV